MPRIAPLTAIFLSPALAGVAVPASGCAVCDCENENIELTFTEAGTAVSPTAVTLSWDTTTAEAECRGGDTDTEACATWRVDLGSSGHPTPAEGVEISVEATVDGVVVDATLVSPGATRAGCCGNGLWWGKEVAL